MNKLIRTLDLVCQKITKQIIHFRRKCAFCTIRQRQENSPPNAETNVNVSVRCNVCVLNVCCEVYRNRLRRQLNTFHFISNIENGIKTNKFIEMTTIDVLVDALPYFDQGYDDAGVRETSLAMVEEECRRYRPTKNYLEHLPPINMSSFETELMANEFERIQNRMTMEPLNMKRYELPPPPPSKIAEISAWQHSIENSMVQLEHQAVRVMNLELMLDYGCETWKVYLEVMTSMLAKAQARLQDIKKEIQDVNWQRKSKQTQAGEKLRSLEAQWVMLVSKNYEIEQACVKLEELIANYKPKEDIVRENGHGNSVMENVPTNGHASENDAEEDDGGENEMEQNQINASNGDRDGSDDSSGNGDSTTDDEYDDTNRMDEN